VRLWVVAAAALALDLWSKSWAFSTLEQGEVVEVIPSVLTFQRSINPGALFGMGQGLVVVFIAASFIALGFVLYLFICSTPERRSLHLALSFILAGSMGNLYDRAFVLADKVTLRSDMVDGRAEFYGTVLDDGTDSGFVRIGRGLDGGPPVHRIPRNHIAEISKAGVVRDFIKIEPQVAGRDIWPWVFNVADSLLVVGVAILVINFWVDRRAPATDAEKASAAVEHA
jgi:lipoprotein signal peptidase